MAQYALPVGCGGMRNFGKDQTTPGRLTPKSAWHAKPRARKTPRTAINGNAAAVAGLLLVSSMLAASGFRRSNFPVETIRNDAAQPSAQSAATLSLSELRVPNQGLVLPLNFGKRTDDLDTMVESRQIRALVVNTRPDFFYVNGQPRGVYYRALQEFQKFVNQKLNKTGALRVSVKFLPVRPDQLEAGLLEGYGDIIATGVAVTPDREQRVNFSSPIIRDVKLVLVSGPNFGSISEPSDLSGKDIYVNPLTFHYQELVRLNERIVASGKPAINIKAADTNLMDVDLIEMVNAGLLPATVTTGERAALWSRVFDQITCYPDIPIASEGQLAWVMRKDNPQFSELVDEFVKGHAVRTLFGNVTLRRYFRNTDWVQDSTSNAEMKKFLATKDLFKKYSEQYDFDYLMIAALGYQESRLDQRKTSPRGAVGIMQVMPKYAAAPPISITDVDKLENNIHAGVKILHDISARHFNDSDLDPINRTLLTFAAYNAGPNRIARLRRRAEQEGLNPNQWFGNVELAVAQDVGSETVQFVSNVYKYYVAYRLTAESTNVR